MYIFVNALIITISAQFYSNLVKSIIGQNRYREKCVKNLKTTADLQTQIKVTGSFVRTSSH